MNNTYTLLLPAKCWTFQYQLIKTPEIHDSVYFFLQNIPQTLHVIMITRHDAPFPLARFRARNEMTEIRAVDLKFTEEEAERFFSEVMGIELPAARVHELFEHAEGWIVGLQMAGLSIQSGISSDQLPNRLSTSNKFMLDYLMEEVLHHMVPGQDRPDEHTLQRTAIRSRQVLCETESGGTAKA